MTPMARLLILLFGLRLLAPSGICLCQLLHLEPAAAHDHDPAAPEEEDEHVPGCPASHTDWSCAVAACVVPDCPVGLDLVPPLSDEPSLSASAYPHFLLCSHPSEPPIYLTVRALLI